MTAFRALLAILFTVLAVYTAFVVAEHGLGLFQVFFGDIAAMAWPGQFNLDFMTFLALSALWLAWRHEFTPAGIVIGLVGFVGGMGFLAPYLFFASRAADGDIQVLFFGRNRAARLKA